MSSNILKNIQLNNVTKPSYKIQQVFNNQQMPIKKHYPLIFHLKQYRNSITDIAVGCIRRQKVDYIRKYSTSNECQPLSNINNRESLNQKTVSYNFLDKASQQKTKKKKYDYGVRLNTAQNDTTYRYQSIQLKRQTNVKNSITKSYSTNKQKIYQSNDKKLQQKHNYITKPFNATQNKEYQNCGNRKELSKNNILSEDNNQEYYLKYKKYDRKNIEKPQLNAKEKQLLKMKNDLENIQIIPISQTIKYKTNSRQLQKSNQKKYNASQYKKNMQNIQKSSLRNNQTLAKKSSNSKQKESKKISENVSKPQQRKGQERIYHKTQTYTSRSDYALDLLSKKLDSYITSHISRNQRNY